MSKISASFARGRSATAATFAQVTLAGTVKDASGGVLPGVTVEASSDVLIEKTRTATADASGQYRIESLQPCTYVVTFTLVDRTSCGTTSASANKGSGRTR